mgnify:CR=1 FL=1
MITVYSKPRCMQCEMTKIWLNQNKIEHENVDIEANPEDPNKAWAGFQVDRLERLIE